MTIGHMIALASLVLALVLVMMVGHAYARRLPARSAAEVRRLFDAPVVGDTCVTIEESHVGYIHISYGPSIFSFRILATEAKAIHDLVDALRGRRRP